MLKKKIDVKKTLKNGDSLELSPKSLVLMNSLAELIQKVNGAALVIDYGENQSFSNSIRVFKLNFLQNIMMRN